jgi:prepilin-type N-terminal cleavage/methylation domain-containing protein
MGATARSEAGFTLAELLVGIVILAIISAALGTALFVGIRSTNDNQTSLDQSNGEQVLANWLSQDVQAACSPGVQGCPAGSNPTLSPTPANACGISGASLSIFYYASDSLASAPDKTAVYSIQADPAVANRWNLVRDVCGFPAGGPVATTQILVRGISSTTATPPGLTVSNPTTGDPCYDQSTPGASIKAVVNLPASSQTDTVPAYSFTLCALRRAA